MSDETPPDLYAVYLDAASEVVCGATSTWPDVDDGAAMFLAALLGFAAGKCLAGCPSQGGAALLSRSALLALVAGKCSAEPQPKMTAIDVLDAIDKWENDSDDMRSIDSVLADLRREVTS